MEFLISIHAQDEIILLEEILPAHTEYKIHGAASYSVIATFGTIFFQKTEGRGFTIWTANYFIEEDSMLVATSKRPVLLLHFIFQNEITLSLKKSEFSLGNGQFNISYIPDFKAQAQLHKGKHLQTFHVHFEYDFLQKFTNGFKRLNFFLNEIKKDKACIITSSPHFATAAMISVINSILKNPYEGKYHQLFTEAQVKILLLQALHKIHDEGYQQSHIRLSAQDIEKIIVARDYLLAHLDTPISIKPLARIAGINDYKLKKGFKQLFGNTIFKYLENERMQKAMALLIETDLSISEIAFILGYSYAHFSGTFKKNFGFPPLYFRK